MIEQLIRQEIRALSAYHVADPGDCIKLDAMENPYPWPESLVQEWLEKLRTVSLNRYPDPAARRLTERLRQSMEVPAGMGILLGNGSDELIQMLALAVAAPDRVIMAPEPSFVMYRMIAQVVGMRYEAVPLTADFALDGEAMLAAMQRHRPAIVFLAYPNNPTGNLFTAADIQRIIQAAPGLVVVDEAYAAFASDSFLAALADYGNLLVLRTVSKMGLAGLRLGMLIGAQAWLGEIDKTRLPYNINVLTQVSAEFALEHAAIMDEQTAAIRRDRETLQAALAAMPELTVYPSEANFILFRTPAGQADRLFAALRDQGILIKNLHGAGGMLTDCLRVTVGTPQENAAFVAALQQALTASGR